ncbi:hypothetical protein AB836_00090 [Rickettsiales bacterium (ex Bugula neritina AB1)]|nr:hypothetical protein AB836_00090 [Rickettsiales bacterium (ex Bugula neritina AB1)]
MQDLFFFRIIYDYFFISEKIDKNNILAYILENKSFMKYMIKNRKVNKIYGFVKYLENKLKVKKYKLILPIHAVDMKNKIPSGIEVIYKNIIDGFIFIDKENFVMWDLSLKKRLIEMKKDILKEQ